eukprot:10429065-Prorocentrum_lima.AAC.1
MKKLLQGTQNALDPSQQSGTHFGSCRMQMYGSKMVRTVSGVCCQAMRCTVVYDKASIHVGAKGDE